MRSINVNLRLQLSFCGGGWVEWVIGEGCANSFSCMEIISSFKLYTTCASVTFYVRAIFYNNTLCIRHDELCVMSEILYMMFDTLCLMHCTLCIVHEE